MRYCAAQEIKKATFQEPKKRFGDLILVRSFRN